MQQDCCILAPLGIKISAPMSDNIYPYELTQLLTKSKSIFLVDLRTPFEYESDHLKGAVCARISTAADVKRLERLIPKGAIPILYCSTGSKSKMISSIMQHDGVACKVLVGGLTYFSTMVNSFRIYITREQSYFVM